MPEDLILCVIDDDVSVRRALSRLLDSAGFRVIRYASAEDYLADHHLKSSCECLILDVNMPGMSGLELQSYLLSQNRACPIVFITAFNNAVAERQALDSGALAFLHKPVDSSRLLQILDSLGR